MQRFEKGTSGAQYVEVSVAEGLFLGLYGDLPEASARKDGRIRRYPVERGLSTTRVDEADEMVTMLETAFALTAKRPAARTFLTDLLARDQRLAFPEAYGMWVEAAQKVGANATLQMEAILAKRSMVILDPLVTAWAGGAASAAGVTQRAKALGQVRRMLAWHEKQTGSPLTADQLTPDFLDGYLHAMLTDSSRFARGKTISKRTVIKHRAALNLFMRWLMSPTAARVAGLVVGQYVLDANPLDHVTDAEVTQTKGDAQEWKKGRVWYTQKEAKAIVNAIDDVETRALLALMFGSMVEYGAVYNRERLKGPVGPVLFKRNFLRDEHGVFTRYFHVAGLQNLGDLTAKGLKTVDRSRDLEIPDAEGFDFYWRIVEAYLKTLAENDPFLTHSHKYYKTRFIAALNKLKLRRAHGRLFHPCRHSFAQFWLPLVMKDRADGRDLEWLKWQAGHASSSPLLITIYTAMTRRKGKGEQYIDEQLSRKQRGLAIA